METGLRLLSKTISPTKKFINITIYNKTSQNYIRRFNEPKLANLID